MCSHQQPVVGPLKGLIGGLGPFKKGPEGCLTICSDNSGSKIVVFLVLGGFGGLRRVREVNWKNFPAIFVQI